MTRRQQLIAGCVALCLVILAGSWFLLDKPRKQAVADLQAKAAQQESTNASTRTQVAVLRDVAARLPAAQKQAAALGNRVPKSPELVSLIRQLTDAAAHSGVDLQGITPTKPTALPVAPGLSSIGLTLMVKGDYPSLEQFETQVEDLKRSFLVTGLTVAGGAAGASSSGTASTSSSAGGADKRLTETITGQVLTGSPTGSAAVRPSTPKSSSTPTS